MHNETATVATMTLTMRASGRIIQRTYPNAYAAERHARELMRQYRTDARFSTQMTSHTITLRHRDSGDVAVIILEDPDHTSTVHNRV